jgi:NADH dehydrogenase
MSLLQPIWVEDVVACFIRALSREETVNHTYQLGGPETFGFEELVDQLAEVEGVRKPRLHFPPILLRPAVAVLSRLLPRFPLSSDQLTMLLEDNVCDITEMERVFNLHPASLRDHSAD